MTHIMSIILYKNAKLAKKGTIADGIAQMFVSVIHDDLKRMDSEFIRIFIFR